MNVFGKTLRGRAAAVLIGCGTLSVGARQWRRSLTLDHDDVGWDRRISEISQDAERTGLMMEYGSVTADLDYIRKWHREHGFDGGVTLRHVERGLYTNVPSGRAKSETCEGSIPENAKIRECYYLYYELKGADVHFLNPPNPAKPGNGERLQQIFIRGTTPINCNFFNYCNSPNHHSPSS